MTNKNKRSEALYIEDMVIAIENVMDFSRGYHSGIFESDHKTSSAILYNLQIVGEGASRATLKTRKAHPEINWRAMKAFRNYLAHEYFGISLPQVWKVIQNNLPGDHENLRKILLELEKAENK